MIIKRYKKFYSNLIECAKYVDNDQCNTVIHKISQLYYV